MIQLTLEMVYLAGNTWSNDYPTTIGAYQLLHQMIICSIVDDAFVSKLDNLFDTQAPIVGPY